MTGRTKPQTTQDHLGVVDRIRPVAEALPVDAVREPDMPVAVFIEEGFSAVAAAREHFGDLSAVGISKEQIDRLEQLLLTLTSCQALWNTERRTGRSEQTAALIEEAEELRAHLVAAAELALRKNLEGQRRLDEIREGDDLADLISDLNDLPVLLTDARQYFEAIKLDVDSAAEKAAQLRDNLRGALAREDVAKTLSGYKEMRDRVYTLTRESLNDLRAFAAFAFRRDKTDQRRQLFTSSYHRRRRARQRRQQQTAE